MRVEKAEQAGFFMSDLDKIIKQLIADHGTTFSIVPDFIKKDKRLSSTDKLVYAELGRLSNFKGYAWPSYRFIAKSIGCGHTAAFDSCNKLIALGYIIKHFKAYNSNRYFLTNRIAYKKPLARVSNVRSLDFYRNRQDERRKAAAIIMKAATRAGLLRDQLIENALNQALKAA